MVGVKRTKSRRASDGSMNKRVKVNYCRKKCSVLNTVNVL